MDVSWLDDVVANTRDMDECCVEDFYEIRIYVEDDERSVSPPSTLRLE